MKNQFNQETTISLILVFLTSFCMLFIEIIYPKILDSLKLFPNVMFVIPITMIGIGLGGFFCFYFQNRQKILKVFSLLFPISIFISFLVVVYIYNRHIIVMSLTIPFFLSSVIIAINFIHAYTNRVYFASLLGSGLGVLCTFFLLQPIGGENCLLFIELVSSAAAVVYLLKMGGSKFQKSLSFIMTGFFAVLLFINIPLDYLNLVKIMPSHEYDETKNIMLLDMKYTYANELLKKGNSDLLYSRWNFISRVDVLKTDLNYAKIVYKHPTVQAETIKKFPHEFFYNGAALTIITDKREIPHKIPPYTLFKNPDILVIGVGGGIDLALARYNGAKSITGVEINPDTVDLMQNELLDISDHVYENATLYTMDGRAYIRMTDKKYDLIVLNYAEIFIPFPNSQVFVENYLYTVEAIQDYWKCLKPNGVLAISKFIRMGGYHNQLLKITSAIIDYFRQANIPDVEKKIIITGVEYQGAFIGGNIFLKKGNFTREEIEKIGKIKDYSGENFLYAPDTPHSPSDFSNLLINSDPDEFISNFAYDIRAITDNRPFLYEFDRKHIFVVEMFKKIGIYCACLFIFPFSVLIVTRELHKDARFMGYCLFFGIIAFAYMFMEIVFIQKLNLYLGSPIYSLAVILTALMGFASFGSLLSGKLGKKFSLFGTMFIPVLLVIYYYFFTPIINSLEFWSTSVRVFFAFLLLFPITFFMGIPFPNMLDNLKKRYDKGYVSLMYGWNGIASVIAVSASLLFSLVYGFQNLFLLGIILYTTVALIYVVLNRL